MLRLRPHHLIDIIRNIGQERPNVPHPYGHAQHIITKQILDMSVKKVKFIIGADDLCTPCAHLQRDGLCNDILSQLENPVSKQHYNDALDHRVFEYLGLKEGEIVQMNDFLDLVELRLAGLSSICTHPKENEEDRIKGLKKGIEKLRQKTMQDVKI